MKFGSVCSRTHCLLSLALLVSFYNIFMPFAAWKIQVDDPNSFSRFNSKLCGGIFIKRPFRCGLQNNGQTNAGGRWGTQWCLGNSMCINIRGLSEKEILKISQNRLVKICKMVFQAHTKSSERICFDIKSSEAKYFL